MSPETVESFEGITTVVLGPAAPVVVAPSTSMGTSNVAHSARTLKVLQAAVNRWIDEGGRRKPCSSPDHRESTRKRLAGNPPGNGLSEARTHLAYPLVPKGGTRSQ